MKNLALASILVITLGFTVTENSFAVCGGVSPNFFCDDNPPNPDLTGIQEDSNDADLTVDILPGAEIDTLNGNGGNGVYTGNGNDGVTVTDAIITADNDAINVRVGNNTITIIRSSLSGGGDGVDSGNGDDVVTITDSRISTDNSVLSLSAGEDEVTVTRSVLRRVVGPENASTVSLSFGNDIITLNTGADISKVISCGNDFDTIVFAMDVPEERLNFYSGQIALATLPDGSVTIDGLSYRWEECELLVNELVGVQRVRPIPTLSQWGLIVMAGVIGIVGVLFVVRRRTVVDS